MNAHTGRNRQTAYERDAQPPAGDSARLTGWAPEMDRLLARGHRFMDAAYSEEGVLYRGMSAGLSEALASGCFGHFANPPPQCALEQELGVVLCSQDLSDALAVARPWENPDGVVLVFPAALFQQAWRARRAAVLAFAEPGVVFRYPFLLDPLRTEALTALVLAPGVAPPAAAAAGGAALVSLPTGLSGKRRETEAAVREALSRRGLAPAATVRGVAFPRAGGRAQ